MAKNNTFSNVYRRRKLQGSSEATSSGHASVKAKNSANWLSVISSDVPSLAANDPLAFSPLEFKAGVPEAHLMPSLVLNGETHGSKSKLTNERPVVLECIANETLQDCSHKTIDVDSINDSCSSSKSNVKLTVASTKNVVDDTGECSSSGIVASEIKGGDLTGEEICMSIIRSMGMLEGAQSTRNSSKEDTAICSVTSCLRSCKVCGRLETSLKLLICDNCENAYHTYCCAPRLKEIPVDEWYCHSCWRKKRKVLEETTSIKLGSVTNEMGKSRNSTSKGEGNPITLMLASTEPYVSNVRVGKGFQAEVPVWSGPVDCDVNLLSEPLERYLSERVDRLDLNSDVDVKQRRICNWLQCKHVIERTAGTICGKWRRAPIFEAQTDQWECFCALFWDPYHADCAVPQEMETDEILKQVKCVQAMRPQMTAKRQKLDRPKSGGSQSTLVHNKNNR